MNDLVEALQADERLAPDPSDVLAGVAGGIRRRRQRRLAGYAASAVALAVVAGTLAVTLPSRTDRAEQPAGTATGEWNRTLRFGWLPDGLATPPLYQASDTEESALYPEANNGRYLLVNLTKVDWRPRLDLPGWRQTQVGGRPARIISRPTRTLITWELPSGRWASLDYGQGRPGSRDAQPGVETSAERIALGVTEGAPEPVRVAFSVGYLPEGMRVVGVRGASPEGFGTIDAVSGTQRLVRNEDAATEDGISLEYPVLDNGDSLDISVHPGAWNPGPGDKRTDDVRGRPAYLLNRDDGIAVDSPDGYILVSTSGRPSPLTAADFRRIAESVRWTG
jgi:hypothetical protein